MPFFKRALGGTGNHYLALDIGTEFVKALLCAPEGTKTRILGVGRKRQKLGEMQSGAVTDIAAVINNCQEAIRDAEKMAGASASQLIMGIAGELVKGATTTINYTRREPDTKIDLAELKNIVHKVEWKAFDEVRAELAYETGYNEIDVKLVNAAIVDVRIDGYKVTNPLGFQGKEIQIGVFNAFAPIVHLGALQTIAENLDLDLLSITAEPYAVAKSMGPEEGIEFSAIFIDIGGGTTDIAIVSNGGVIGTKMFALGGRAFTKRISHMLNINRSDAEELKLAYSQGKITSGDKKKVIEKAIEADCEVWISGVELTLSEFKNIDLLPSRILLCGGGTLLPQIKKTLLEKRWAKNIPFSRKPNVNFIKPKNISNVIDKTGKLVSTSDVTPMSMASLAIELVGDEGVVDGMLSKVAKTLRS